MLESIHISQFAIIDQLDIDFARGMTSLTGETGAGKSILLDALQMVLGDRADVHSVKDGAEKAVITVSFDLTKQADALDWLKENELDSESDCLLRRVIQSNGRSKAFINGLPVTVTQMKTLGEILVDVHGQHEHQSLQKAEVQRQLLDACLDSKQHLSDTDESYHKWKQCKRQLQLIMDDSQHKQQRIDLLKLYQQEFDDLNLQKDEWEKLQSEYQQSAHAGQIIESCNAVCQLLSDDENRNSQSLLASASQQMLPVANLDPTLKELSELIDSSLIQVQEAASSLRSYIDNIDVDPARLDWLNQRIGQIQAIARKHQTDPENLLSIIERNKDELDSLTGDESDIAQLQQQLDEAWSIYHQNANALSSQRQLTANKISDDISREMQQLGMEGGRFSIAISSISDPDKAKSHGMDQILFEVSANPGQPLKPLGRVASGGELSRISLAIQVRLSEVSQIPTLIFDEVDSGIGGGIAEVVGKKLRAIAKDRQVFCVTHLPQVASQAHQHFRVSKTKTENQTLTQLSELDQNQRKEEIARMLGGLEITQQSLDHAEEMLSRAG